MTILRFAVVGCGRMGRRRARTIATHKSAELVAVADLIFINAHQLASKHGCNAYEQPDELFTLPEVDTVFICTPNKFHAPLAIAAMRLGKHVVCEKPLACTPSEAATMVREAENNGVTLKVGSNLRFFANIRKAHQLVTTGQIGKLLFLRAWIGNAGWPRDGWFANPDVSGGGTVIDNGCHMFDLIRWFLGDVDSCIGQVMNLHWKIQVEDNGIGVFTTCDGIMASVHSSWTEWQEYFSLDIYGSKGLVQVVNRLPVVHTVLMPREGDRQVFDFVDAPIDSYEQELSVYLDDRQRGGTPTPCGYDGLRVLEMAHAIYESSRSGRRIKLRRKEQ